MVWLTFHMPKYTIQRLHKELVLSVLVSSRRVLLQMAGIPDRNLVADKHKLESRIGAIHNPKRSRTVARKKKNPFMVMVQRLGVGNGDDGSREQKPRKRKVFPITAR